MATYNVGKNADKIRKQIAASYTDIQKADNGEAIGSIKEWGGHEYIKTADGWKYHNKGVGKVTVQAGHKIVTKEGVHGEVKHRDKTHTYIEHQTESGQSKVSKIKNQDIDNNIVGHNYKHYVPADKIKSADPKDIKDMKGAFEQMNAHFKGDKSMEQVLQILQPLVEQDKNIRYDPEMEFPSDQYLGLAHVDGRIGINVHSKLAGSKDTMYRNLVHETVHAVTRQKIETNEVLRDELNDVLGFVKKQAEEQGKSFYGLTNVHEMVAEIFSDKDFYNFLSTIKTEDKKKDEKESGNGLDNVLRKVFLAIAAVFSSEAKSIKKVKESDVDNLADYLMEITKSVMNKKPSPEAIEKSDINELESEESFDILKGKLGAPIGTIKDMGGRKYIKTADKKNPWKYYGSGEGSKAQSHASGNKVAPSKPVSSGKPVEEEVVAKPTTPENPIDINERFQASGRQTKAVISGAAKAQILYGGGGVGKTYGVEQKLIAAGMKKFDEDIHQPATSVSDDSDEDGIEKDNDEGVKSTDYDYIKITGKMTTPQVYKALYEHNGKLLMFDDCDSVLRDANTVNLFKGALDTSGDGTISYGTSTGVKDEAGNKLPKRFKFTGKVIFISNLPSEDVPQPIKSRALRADLSMTPEQTIDRLKFIAKNKEGKYQNLKFKGIGSYSHKDMEDIINFLDKHKHNTSDLNVRTVGSMLAIKKIADEEGHDWKKDAEHMIFSKGEEIDIYNGGIQKAKEMNLMKSYGCDDRMKKAKSCGNMGAKSEMYKGDEYDEDCCDDEENELEKGGVGSGKYQHVKLHPDDNVAVHANAKEIAEHHGMTIEHYNKLHINSKKDYLTKMKVAQHQDKMKKPKKESSPYKTFDAIKQERLNNGEWKKSEDDELNKAFESLGI